MTHTSRQTSTHSYLSSLTRESPLSCCILRSRHQQYIRMNPLATGKVEKYRIRENAQSLSLHVAAVVVEAPSHHYELHGHYEASSPRMKGFSERIYRRRMAQCRGGGRTSHIGDRTMEKNRRNRTKERRTLGVLITVHRTTSKCMRYIVFVSKISPLTRGEWRSAAFTIPNQRWAARIDAIV